MGRYGYPQCYLAERGRAFLGYIIIMTGGLCVLMGVLIVVFSFVILGIINPYTIVVEVRVTLGSDKMGHIRIFCYRLVFKTSCVLHWSRHWKKMTWITIMNLKHYKESKLSFVWRGFVSTTTDLITRLDGVSHSSKNFMFWNIILVNFYSLYKKYSNTPYMVVYLLCGITQTLVNLVATYTYKVASRSVSREKMNSGLILKDTNISLVKNNDCVATRISLLRCCIPKSLSYKKRHICTIDFHDELINSIHKDGLHPSVSYTPYIQCHQGVYSWCHLPAADCS